MLEKIYEELNDVHVRLRKVYCKASDAYGYVDKKCTVKVKTAELQDAFRKGMIVVDASGNEYVPTSCAVSSGVATVTYITVTTSSSTSVATPATIKSDNTEE